MNSIEQMEFMEALRLHGIHGVSLMTHIRGGIRLEGYVKSQERDRQHIVVRFCVIQLDTHAPREVPMLLERRVHHDGDALA